MILTGQNLVWSAFAHLCVGLMKDDTSMLQQVRDAVASESIPIDDGKLSLGTWQGIYLCEHRNHGGAREVVATVFGE